MVTFVTDRTHAHVARLQALAAKGWNNMSASERSEWMGESGDTWKGAYNYTDLNRVESAVKELSEKLGLGLTTKTDWSMWDVPGWEELTRYIGNIQAIRDEYRGSENIPSVPSIELLDWKKANNIETILKMVYIENLPEEVAVLGMAKLGYAIIG